MTKIATLDPNSTIARAYFIMGHLKRDTLPVVFAGQVVGVLSMQDILSLASSYTASNNSPKALIVGKFMRGPVSPVEGSKDLFSVIQIILNKNYYAVVVKENDHILGVLSRDNLLELLANLVKENKATAKDTLLAFPSHTLAQ